MTPLTEEQKEKNRQRYYRNKEKFKKRMREHYQKNKERILAEKREHRKIPRYKRLEMIEKKYGKEEKQ